MKKIYKKILIFTICLICIAVWIKYAVIYPLIHTTYNGNVTDVIFDKKGYSKFQINNKNKWYDMHYLDCDLKVGDSMVKKLDDTYIFHYRNSELIGKYSSVFGLRYYK